MDQTFLKDDVELHVEGRVKWYCPNKGFGFIAPNQGGAEVLLHAHVLRDWGVSSIAPGSAVSVSVAESERGLRASSILSVAGPDDVQELDQETEMLPARVKWFSREKGFGFVNVFGQSNDILIGSAALQRSGLTSLENGEAVAIHAERGENGYYASVVQPWDRVGDI